MGLISNGLTNQEITGLLPYGASTVRKDTSAIYKKLGVADRAQAVAKALGLGLKSP